jgi:hypothetical protein
MKLYKFRDFSQPDEVQFHRLSETLRENAFWCARPSELNDPEEFKWVCDYQTTQFTIPLLSELLMKFKGHNQKDAQALAFLSVSNGRLEPIATGVFSAIVEQCRNEIGLACFGSSLDNEVMWQRYGGNGAGICIEIDAPSSLLGHELQEVKYPPVKRLHVDQLLGSCLEGPYAKEVYSVSLLSKTQQWAPEAEIRFVSRRQNVFVCIDGSHISRLFLGPTLEPRHQLRIQEIVSNLPYHLPVSAHVA